MAIEIIQHDERNLTINGKEVYRDVNDKWVTSEPISHEELRAFRQHLQSTDRND